MSDENIALNGAEAPAEATGATFMIEKIYTRDISFEVPNAPQVFTEQGQPELQMNLAQRMGQIAENVYEVVLTVTITCTMNGKNAYLAEVQQAGIFGLQGFDAQGLDAMLGAHCPNILYPYARQSISDMIVAGGFPPFYMQPINFDALYAQSLQQRAEGAPALADGTETAGNA
ncbi:protein-export chaperone SecB [Lysobacter sp. HDW10]|jgi:preprotein translocase subunit SecB|uniref:protein-export chaperone SecB n=1 Tax=Lysobacter sp. HDW10 TaxID=2714936 RepID=UPI0014095660|nr:protein-export chaperone SecB [Lysobacter sp. HDW10]QIK80699.1 protein-export chaperone SecB [Lysobacter sp. HDW10]